MDEAHEITEEMLAELEERIAKEYKQAIEETEKKLLDYLRKFAIKLKIWEEWVKGGKKTEEEFKRWRLGQIIVGKRWETMKDEFAEVYHNANVVAMQMVQDVTPAIYAENINYATYQVEKAAKIDTSFTLYDKPTVQRLMKDDPDLLPPPGKKMQKEIEEAAAEGKDIRWNKQQVQSVATQSIVQGESIPEMAERLSETVGESNHKAAIRNARTMATSAQNAGRVDGYKRAEEMGVNLKQTWVATLDNRTRHSHRQLDKETIEVGGTFSNGCKFPGDPDGLPSEVYNCRCTLVAEVEGLEYDWEGRVLADPDQTYDDWKQGHSKPQKITCQEETGEAIKQSYVNEYRRKRGRKKK